MCQQLCYQYQQIFSLTSMLSVVDLDLCPITTDVQRMISVDDVDLFAIFIVRIIRFSLGIAVDFTFSD